jgi:hypothetical protein
MWVSQTCCMPGRQAGSRHGDRQASMEKAGWQICIQTDRQASTQAVAQADRPEKTNKLGGPINIQA